MIYTITTTTAITTAIATTTATATATATAILYYFMILNYNLVHCLFFIIFNNSYVIYYNHLHF